MSALAAMAVVVAAPFVGAPTPATPVDSYRAVVDATGSPNEVRLVAPDRFASRFVEQGATPVVGVAGTYFVGKGAIGDGSVSRRSFPALPDGGDYRDRYGSLVDHVLSEARADRLKLARVRLRGQAAYLATVPLAANDCAGLPPRTGRVWLSADTLLPLRVVERRRGSGAVTSATTYSYSQVNGRFPAGTFDRPRLGPRPSQSDAGFRRVPPASAAGPLPYVPRLPAVLPPGFTIEVSGWAPRSRVTGPEGSIPAAPMLFQARYRRGQETLDVTMRAGGGKDWPADPFGGECEFLREEAVTVNGLRGTFGTGTGSTPHVYWRDGNLLLTVSGPFPKDDLVAVAASMRPLGP